MKTTNAITMKGKQFGMKSLLALFLLVASTFTASAQKSAVLDALAKHHIDASILNPESIKEPSDYGYDLKQTTIAAGKESITIANFDPSKPKEEQWTVVSLDGKSPSKSDIKTFRKNQSSPDDSSKPDESSYKVEKESPDYLVFSYKLDPNSIPKEAAFMKDCRSIMTINLKTKKLEQSQTVNEKPLRIKILTAEKFDLIMKYSWNEQAKRYVPIYQDLNMVAKFLGQSANVQTTTEYTNYAKK